MNKGVDSSIQSMLLSMTRDSFLQNVSFQKIFPSRCVVSDGHSSDDLRTIRLGLYGHEDLPRNCGCGQNVETSSRRSHARCLRKVPVPGSLGFVCSLVVFEADGRG